MLMNYLKIAWRALWRNKLHSFINVASLAIGISVTIMVGDFVVEELTLNANLKDVDRTYVIESKWNPENLGAFYTTLGPLAHSLKEEYPTLVEDAYRYTLASSIVSTKSGRVFREQLQIGDSSLIEMFDFPVLHGTARTAFEPDGVIITRSIAEKYFGRSDVVGETLTLATNSGSRVDCHVTAVLENLKSTSVVNFSGNPLPNEIFLPMRSLRYFMKDADKDWWFKYMVTLVKVRPTATAEDVEVALRRLISSYAPPEFRDNLQPVLKALKTYHLQWADGRAMKLVRSLSAITIFIVLLVLANFISITISSSASRLREIGLRKLFGGKRRQLIIQFLVENIVISVAAMLLAFILHIFLRPVFETLLERPLTSLDDFKPATFILALLFTFIMGCMAGLYPAIRLSSFGIVRAVKGKLPGYGEGRLTRKVLLTLQISIASFILICSFFIGQQISFIQQYDLGFEQEGILVITSVPREWTEAGLSRMKGIRTEFMNDAAISSASLSYEVPDGNAGTRNNFKSENGSEVDMPLINVDEHFASTFGLEVISGSFFAHPSGDRNNGIILNESAVKQFGWTPLSAIGQHIGAEGEEARVVVGVVSDFHFYSLMQPMSALALGHIADGNTYRYLSLRTENGVTPETIERIRSKWSRIFPDAPFEYSLMEEKVNHFYALENRICKSSRVAGLLTLLITMTGLIAFMSVNLSRRMAELGIRRIHGATSTNLLTLLAKEFSTQFIFAATVATIASYFFLDSWLHNFQYRISLEPIFFILTHLLILVAFLLLIISYALRAVSVNPVKVLRHE